MAITRHLFSSDKSSYGDRFITLVNGSSLKVVSVGFVNLGPYLSLSNVFHIPGLSYSLLSINKLTAKLTIPLLGRSASGPIPSSFIYPFQTFSTTAVMEKLRWWVSVLTLCKTPTKYPKQ